MQRLRWFTWLALLLACFETTDALWLNPMASNWPSECHPDSVRVHWQIFQDGEWLSGWANGRVTGPSGNPFSYTFAWCSSIVETDSIPLFATITQLEVTLNTGVRQYLDHTWYHLDCGLDDNHIIMSGVFNGCEEMQSAIGDPVLPQALSLEQNYPNPFNPNTTIKFSLPVPGSTQLIVRNLLGQQIEKLVNDQLSAGNHELQLNASNLSSGIYFYTLTFNGQSVTKQMLLLK